MTQRLAEGLIESLPREHRQTVAEPRYRSRTSHRHPGAVLDACDRLDLHWTWSPPKTIYVSRKADVARMDEFIGPKR